MRYMATYDLMETIRNTNQWLGATALAYGSYPITGIFPTPLFQVVAAWGEVTERSFARMVAKPDWGINSIVGDDGRDHVVEIVPVVKRPFGNLIHFKVLGRKRRSRRVLLVAPMSGHYATLLRSTVISMLPDCEVYITDWHNARDIPVSEGKFDVEDYTKYLVEFLRVLGHSTHVVAVCQPAPLALVATAYLAKHDPVAQPRTLTLIGGPIDPAAAATDVTDFGRTVTMGQLEKFALQRVGFKYAGTGRMVYPGLAQLAGFISMNGERHAQAFFNQILRVAKGEAGDHDKHNRFYDEYLAVMDMTAEFYLSTVERIFKTREIARNAFSIDGEHVDITQIRDVAVKVVEGEKDDISAPGQCLAALDLLPNVPADRKASHVEPGAGHYGIFAGRSWRDNIRPLVMEFIDANAAPAEVSSRRKASKGGEKPEATEAGTGTGTDSAAAAAVPVEAVEAELDLDKVADPAPESRAEIEVEAAASSAPTDNGTPDAPANGGSLDATGNGGAPDAAAPNGKASVTADPQKAGRRKKKKPASSASPAGSETRH